MLLNAKYVFTAISFIKLHINFTVVIEIHLWLGLRSVFDVIQNDNGGQSKVDIVLLQRTARNAL